MIFPRVKPITRKRLSQLERDFNGRKYQEWRNYILNRDDNTCQYPNCSEKNDLQVHHIKRFASNKHLKTATYNGISLCVKHHKMIYNKEKFYEMLFFKITRHNEKIYKEKLNGKEKT